MGLLDFMYSSKLFLLTFLFGSFSTGEKSLSSFLSLSFKATHSSSDRSGEELEVLTDYRLVVVTEVAAI